MPLGFSLTETVGREVSKHYSCCQGFGARSGGRILNGDKCKKIGASDGMEKKARKQGLSLSCFFFR